MFPIASLTLMFLCLQWCCMCVCFILYSSSRCSAPDMPAEKDCLQFCHKQDEYEQCMHDNGAQSFLCLGHQRFRRWRTLGGECGAKKGLNDCQHHPIADTSPGCSLGCQWMLVFIMILIFVLFNILMPFQVMAKGAKVLVCYYCQHLRLTEFSPTFWQSWWLHEIWLPQKGFVGAECLQSAWLSLQPITIHTKWPSCDTTFISVFQKCSLRPSSGTQELSTALSPFLRWMIY